MSYLLAPMARSSITHLIDVKDGQVDAKMAVLREHCLDQAKRFSPMVFV